MGVNTRSRQDLKSYFVKNAIPTESNFADLIEGMINQNDDGVIKLPGDPLSIQGQGDDNSPKTALSLYWDIADAAPAWSLSLNPDRTPGLGVTDGEGRTRLFIDRDSGGVGIGNASPGTQLHITGGSDASLSGAGFLILGDTASDNIVIGNSEIIARKGGASSTLHIQAEGGDTTFNRNATGSVAIKKGNLILTGSEQIVFSDADTSNNLKLQLWSGYGLGVNGNTLFYAAHGNHSWRDRSGSNERMKLTTAADGHLEVQGTGTSTFAGALTVSGNVGIGTTAPDNRLEVNGSIEIQVEDGDSKLRFHDPGNAWYSMGIDKSDGEKFKINLGGNIGDAVHFAMDKSGNIGIGTNSPEAKLHSAGETGRVAFRAGQNEGGNDFTIDAAGGQGLISLVAGAKIKPDGSGYTFLGTRGASKITLNDGVINFHTSNDTTGVAGEDAVGLSNNAERMMIDNAGNVGIGTKNPGALLSLGSWGSGPSGSAEDGSAQLLLSGAHNEGVNGGGTTGTYKLMIEGYQNDGEIVYPIYLRDENGLVDFWIKNRASDSVEPTMYFAGTSTFDGYVASKSVYFSAYVDSNDYGNGQNPLPMRQNSQNVGGGWSNADSKFTAPVSGVYLFTMTGYKSANDGVSLHWYLRKNSGYANSAGAGEDSEKGLMTMYKVDTTSSRTLVVRLNRDDQIYIQQTGTGRVDNYRSGLEGVLLYAIT